MKKVMIVLVAIVLTACATTEPPQPTKQPAPMRVVVKVKPEPAPVIDVNCAKLAEYVREVAIIRDAGGSLDTITHIMPAPDHFPAGPIEREVLARKDLNPIDGEKDAYATCVKTGFANMRVAMYAAEAKFVDDQIEAKKAELAKKNRKRK